MQYGNITDQISPQIFHLPALCFQKLKLRCPAADEIPVLAASTDQWGQVLGTHPRRDIHHLPGAWITWCLASIYWMKTCLPPLIIKILWLQVAGWHIWFHFVGWISVRCLFAPCYNKKMSLWCRPLVTPETMIKVLYFTHLGYHNCLLLSHGKLLPLQP